MVMRAKRIYSYCIFAVFFVCAMVNTTQGAMLSSWIEHYRLESAAQGAVGSAQSAGMTAALFVLIWQAGKVSKNTIITFSFVALVALLFAASFMPPFTLLIALFCLVGIFYGALSSLSSSVMADLYSGEESSKHMSRLHGVYGLGGLILPFIFRGLLGGGMYWNAAFRIMAFITAAIFIVFLIFSKHSLRSIVLPRRSGQRVARSDLIAFFKRGQNIILILSVFFYGAHQSVIMVWLIRYVEVFLGSAALSSLALSLYWAGVTLTRLLIHKILPVPPIKIVLFGNIVAALAICAGVLSGSAIVVTVLAFITGVANGTSVPVAISACCTDNDVNSILPANVMNISLYTAFFVCPLAVGALVSYASLGAGMYLGAFFALMCGLMTFLYWRKTPRARC